MQNSNLSYKIEYKTLLVRLLPMMFFLVYLSMTVFIFLFGPWHYPVKNMGKFIWFILAAHSALFLGYISAVFGESTSYYNRLWPPRRILFFCVVVTLLLFPFTSLFRTGAYIPNFMKALSNVGEAYERFGFHHQTGIPIIEYINILFGPILFMVLPLTVFYWSQLSRKIRIVAVIAIISKVALYVAMGTNKAFADVVLLVPSMAIAAYLSGKYPPLNFKKRLLFFVLFISIAISFFLFFTATQSQRSGSSAEMRYFPRLGLSADMDNFMVRYFPSNMQVGVLGLTLYTSHGYYGLSLALDEPFVPMYGVGHSMFLFRQAARITGNDAILEMPYPVRISKYGWDAYGVWSTIYPWIASDVSFVGTIAVVFLIGYLFAKCWLDTLDGTNPFAVAMFSQFVIMIFYFSANNQCTQNGSGFTAFWGLFIMWFLTRRHYVWGRE